MAALKRIKTIYRTILMHPLLYVLKEAGIWEKYGLDVEIILITKTSLAEDLLISGEVDMIFGNHTSAYVARSKGHHLVYLASTVNRNSHVLVTSPAISSLQQLRGKKIVVSEIGTHPEVQLRGYLEKAGVDPEKEVDRVPLKGDNDPLRMLVMVTKGEVDAALLWPPFDLKAQKEGINTIYLPKSPMIRGLTPQALSKYIRENEETIVRVLKALIEGIYFFKTFREQTLKIMGGEVAKTMGLTDQDLIRHIYEYTRDDLAAKPYPSPVAIYNVFSLVVKDHPELAGLNPLSLWDMHYLRQIEESGFIDSLYQNRGSVS